MLTAATAMSPDGTTIVGYGQNPLGRREAWVATLPRACYPNCDGSTFPPYLASTDFICYLNKYAAASAYANCDGSTIAPVLNVSDFLCYMSRFAAGCP